VLLILASLLGLPAGVLRAMCAGRSCDSTNETVGDVPYCSLPEELRTLIAAGYRDGRSGDIFGVTGRATISEHRVMWPSVQAGGGSSAVTFFGTGVETGASTADGITLDAIAPTIADIIGLKRPHPEVRSGRAVPGVAIGRPPKLVVEVVLKDVGAHEVGEDTAPFLAHIFRRGASTLTAATGSLPADPAATITTIGTGGLPRQHGITGRLIRNEGGRLVRPWSSGAPPSVIATLGDDLDERNNQRARIGLIATHSTERGLIGGNWYTDVDRDDFEIASTPRRIEDVARGLLTRGYGKDRVPDLLGIVLPGALQEVDHAIAGIYRAARRATESVALIIATIGHGSVTEAGPLGDRRIVDAVEADIGAPVIEGIVAGSLFLDQEVLADRQISEDAVARALASVTRRGRPIFDDVFPAISISFGRYC
jgi:hypothetical protein